MGEDLSVILSDQYLPSSVGFVESEYQSHTFRYIQLPDSENGVSYVIGGTNYIISTSKDSFRAATREYLK